MLSGNSAKECNDAEQHCGNATESFVSLEVSVTQKTATLQPHLGHNLKAIGT